MARFRLVGCAVLCFAGVLARAGHYEVVSISGGKTTSNNGPDQDYGGDHLSWSGARSANVVTASGEVEIEFVWVPDPEKVEDPHPTSVIVSQVCVAGATAYSTTYPTVSASNGIGDAAVPTYQFTLGYWTATIESKGQEYEVRAGDDSLKVTLSPAASASGDWVSQCSAEVSVQVLPLKVVLDGVTSYGGHDTILQGQRCDGTLQLQGVTGVPHFPGYSHGGDIVLSGHSWGVPGNTFLDFDVTPPSGVVTLPDAAWWQQESPYWYWRGPAELGQGANAAEMTVSVSAQAECNEGELGTVGAAAKVKNYRPYYAMLPTAGPVNWVSVWPEVWAVRAGPGGLYVEEDKAGESGIAVFAYVQAQSWFASPPDVGQYAWSQLCQLERVLDGIPIVPAWYFMTFKHDGPFPYKGPVPAFGTDGDFAYDDPTWLTSVSYSVADEFRHYLLFKPPGPDSRFTPLAFVYWNWDTLGFAPFTPVPIGNVYVTSDDDTDEHPVWQETRG